MNDLTTCRLSHSLLIMPASMLDASMSDCDESLISILQMSPINSSISLDKLSKFEKLFEGYKLFNCHNYLIYTNI